MEARRICRLRSSAGIVRVSAMTSGTVLNGFMIGRMPITTMPT